MEALSGRQFDGGASCPHVRSALLLLAKRGSVKRDLYCAKKATSGRGQDQNIARLLLDAAPVRQIPARFRQLGPAAPTPLASQFSNSAGDAEPCSSDFLTNCREHDLPIGR